MNGKIKKIVSLVLFVLLVMIIVQYIRYQSIHIEQLLTTTIIVTIGISIGVLTPRKMTLKNKKNDH